MMGPTHRCFGALCGAGYATATGMPVSMVAMTALVSTATSHGWSSPDMDQTGPWRAVGKIVPRWAGRWFDGLWGHRHLSHWWGVPVAAWWGIQHMPTGAQWPAMALLVGWVSHLLGDAIFGELPVLPWGGWFLGFGLDTGGFIETGRTRVAGRERTVLPFGPARLVIVAALGFLLAAAPGMHLPAIPDRVTHTIKEATR